MPHLPSEENAPDGIFEKVAENPSAKSESTATGSDGQQTEPTETGQDSSKASLQSSPGPAIVSELPDEEGSKEDRRAKKEALNQ